MPPQGRRSSPATGRHPPQRPRQSRRRVPSPAPGPGRLGAVQIGASGEGEDTRNFPSSSAARRPYPSPRLPRIPAAAEGLPPARSRPQARALLTRRCFCPWVRRRETLGSPWAPAAWGRELPDLRRRGRAGRGRPQSRPQGGGRTARRGSARRRLPRASCARPRPPSPSASAACGATRARRLTRLQPVRGSRQAAGGRGWAGSSAVAVARAHGGPGNRGTRESAGSCVRSRGTWLAGCARPGSAAARRGRCCPLPTARLCAGLRSRPRRRRRSEPGVWGALLLPSRVPRQVTLLPVP